MTKPKARAAVKQTKVDTVMELARAKRGHLKRVIAMQRELEQLARKVTSGAERVQMALFSTARNIYIEAGFTSLRKADYDDLMVGRAWLQDRVESLEKQLAQSTCAQCSRVEDQLQKALARIIELELLVEKTTNGVV